ncbi:MAG: hypothetical protein ACK4YK_00930 [Dolichospermum sp.]|nr:hypothetical protein [Anabaena sp. WA102]
MITHFIMVGLKKSTTVSVDLPSRGINAENATIFSHIDTKGAEGGF